MRVIIPYVLEDLAEVKTELAFRRPILSDRFIGLTTDVEFLCSGAAVAGRTCPSLP